MVFTRYQTFTNNLIETNKNIKIELALINQEDHVKMLRSFILKISDPWIKLKFTDELEIKSKLNYVSSTKFHYFKEYATSTIISRCYSSIFC